MGSGSIFQAVLDFRRARNEAQRERFRARLRGESAELLSYEQVRHMLRAQKGSKVSLREIPLESIVGSVGRYTDFTRDFLPLQDDDEQRWARVQVKLTELEGLPPIEVYQIGDTYFVRDGNHRVSVLRRLGATHIQAYVTEVKSRVPLSPDVQPDDLILKAEYAEFLEQTRLDEIRPAADLTVTAPGKVPAFLDHVDVHRYYMGLDQAREIGYAEAVAHWYDEVYLPVVDVIREQKILEHFPGRTEADLYLWLSDHRGELEQELGWEIETGAAAADLVEQFDRAPQHRLQRAARKLADALTPDELEGGPPPGTWRRERLSIHRDDCLFADILVPVSGDEHSWQAAAQAIEIACRENARLLGLHVVPTARAAKNDRVEAIRGEFARRCKALGVRGKLAVEVGRVARTICERSRWADLVVLGLAHPPATQPVTRLGSGFRTLIRRCPTPVLTVPGVFSPLDRPLLAYDGSPKAREALYIATYLAARGQVPLLVVNVVEAGEVTPDTLAEAGQYLAGRGVEAHLIKKYGPVDEVILAAAQKHDSDLILMGGYGLSPVVEVVLGSAVDGVLRASRQPVLICR